MRYSEVLTHNGYSRATAHTKDVIKKSAFQQYILKEQRLLSLKYPFLTQWQIKRKALDNWKKLISKDIKERFVRSDCKSSNPRFVLISKYFHLMQLFQSNN